MILLIDFSGKLGLDDAYYFFKFFVFIVILVSFPFSPVVTFLFSSIYLIFFSIDYKFGRIFNYFVYFVSSFSYLVINNSRSFYEELSLDLGVYYNLFLELQANGFFNVNNQFGGGVEIGWPFIYSLLTSFHLTPYDLIFINNFLTILLCFVWFFVHGFKVIEGKFQGIMVLSFLIFFSIATTNFLERQALSTAILMFAVSNISNKKFILYIALASFFHLSAILIGFIYFFMSRLSLNLRNIFLLIFFGILFRVSFFVLVKYGASISFLSFLSLKFSYYGDASFSIASFRYPILILPLLVLAYLNKERYIVLSRIVFFSCCLYYVFLGIPLFSERINMAILMFYGYFVLLFSLSYYRAYLLIFLVYLIAFIIEKDFSSSGLSQFWFRYEPISFNPFYYLR